MVWAKWHRQIELGLLVLVLVALGMAQFSQITPQQQRQIELEAGLEQLYELEQLYHARHGRYFDPTDSTEGLEWKWMKAYEWEFGSGEESFRLRAKADLDGDGAVGIWEVGDQGPQVHQVADD